MNSPARTPGLIRRSSGNGRLLLQRLVRPRLLALARSNYNEVMFVLLMLAPLFLRALHLAMSTRAVVARLLRRRLLGLRLHNCPGLLRMASSTLLGRSRIYALWRRATSRGSRESPPSVPTSGRRCWHWQNRWGGEGGSPFPWLWMLMMLAMLVPSSLKVASFVNFASARLLKGSDLRIQEIRRATTECC